MAGLAPRLSGLIPLRFQGVIPERRACAAYRGSISQQVQALAWIPDNRQGDFGNDGEVKTTNDSIKVNRTAVGLPGSPRAFPFRWMAASSAAMTTKGLLMTARSQCTARLLYTGRH
jgi:hypothetical protein